MSIYKSYRKLCPDLIVNEFVTNVIKTAPVRESYSTVRVTPKNDTSTDKTLTYCALTSLSVVCRKGCEVDIVDVVVKSAPKNDKLRKCIPVSKLFAREAFFYDTVLAELLEFEEKAKVKFEDRIHGGQTLIAANLDEGEEALVLQRSSVGWVPKYEKWVGELTQGHMVTVMAEFSRFHALNFAFGKIKQKRFEEFKKELTGGFLSTLENHHTEKIIKKNLDQTIKYFTDDKIVKKLKTFQEGIEGFLKNILNVANDVSVLLHGDLTTICQFCNEKSKESVVLPARTKLTDWQLVRFGSPVLDLAIFLFTNCSLDDLRNMQFLKIYHSNLQTFLKGFKFDTDEFLSFERLEREWKKYAKFGLALSFINLKILSLESNKRPNANNEELSSEEFLEGFISPPNAEFIRRIQDIVKYCVEEELI